VRPGELFDAFDFDAFDFEPEDREEPCDWLLLVSVAMWARPPGCQPPEYRLAKKLRFNRHAPR
jgi:hypothetical protein